MSDETKVPLLDRLFELRTIVAILFGVYGVFCVIWGIGFTDAEDLRRAAGYNVNLLAGIGMLVASAVFAVWAVLDPIEQVQHRAEDADADSAS